MGASGEPGTVRFWQSEEQQSNSSGSVGASQSQRLNKQQNEQHRRRDAGDPPCRWDKVVLFKACRLHRVRAAAIGLSRRVFSTRLWPKGASRFTQTSIVPPNSPINTPYATVVAIAVERNRLLIVALINIERTADTTRQINTCATCGARMGLISMMTA